MQGTPTLGVHIWNDQQRALSREYWEYARALNSVSVKEIKHVIHIHRCVRKLSTERRDAREAEQEPTSVPTQDLCTIFRVEASFQLAGIRLHGFHIFLNQVANVFFQVELFFSSNCVSQLVYCLLALETEVASHRPVGNFENSILRRVCVVAQRTRNRTRRVKWMHLRRLAALVVLIFGVIRNRITRYTILE